MIDLVTVMRLSCDVHTWEGLSLPTSGSSCVSFYRVIILTIIYVYIYILKLNVHEQSHIADSQMDFQAGTIECSLFPYFMYKINM